MQAPHQEVSQRFPPTQTIGTEEVWLAQGQLVCFYANNKQKEEKDLWDILDMWIQMFCLF